MLRPPNSHSSRLSPHDFDGLIIAVLFVIFTWWLTGCAGVTIPNSSHAATTLTVTLTSLPSAKVQTNYSASLTASGGTLPYTWTITSGNLPSGLALSSSSGLISGMPSQQGSANFTVQVKDSSATPLTASAPLAITVSAATTALGITTSSLAAGTQGTAYTATLAASGGTSPYTWSVASGQLPTGLTLSSAGVLSGTPTASGSSFFTVNVTDSSSPQQSASANLSIVISTVLQITTANLPGAAVSTAYNTTLAASGGVTPYTWTLQSGSLPAGLSLSTSGQITGTPTTSGLSSFTIQAKDSSSPSQTASKGFSISVAAAGGTLQVSTVSLPPGQIGVSYSSVLTAVGGAQPYSWSITSGTLPAGLSLSNATISGNPTQVGTSVITVQVQDSSATPQKASKSFSIAIAAAAVPLSITTASLSSAQVNSSYASSLAATGGTAPYSWSLSSGSLPPGLSLNATSGQISGTPTQAGTSSFTVKATDSSSPAQTATKTLSITVTAAVTPVQITSISIPAGQAGTAYSTTLAATGGTTPYSWSISSGSLPAGLSLSTSGTISGTPTAAGSSTFTVKATDSTTPTAQTATQSLTITISAAVQAVQITTTSVPAGQTGTSYSTALSATGGTTPYSWSISSGSLPGGLSFSTAGTISGTPTTAGSSTFTVKVTDSTTPTPKTATQSLTITVSTTVAALQITTTSVPAGKTGTAYSATLAATGGTTPYSWSISSGSLPAGLSLSTGGTISGTPTTAGSSTFTVKLTDSTTPTAKTATQSLTITISTTVPTLQITTTSIPAGQVGTAYSAQLSASGGTTPYTWSLSQGALPAGMSLSASTGTFAGTPTTSGSFTFTIKVTDSTTPTAQTATQSLTFTVAAAATPVSITTSSLASGQVGSTYSAVLSATGGTTPYTWSISSGSLPSGLTLAASTGTISGTPNTAGTVSFTVQVSDAGNNTATKTLSIIVGTAVAPLSITTSALSNGQQGDSYSSTLAATGGTAPYTWSIISGSLPAGLTLTASSGLISGTPTSSGNFSVTVQVADSTVPTVQTSTKALSLTINASGSTALSTISVVAPPALQGVPYTSGNGAGAGGAILGISGGQPPYTCSVTSGSIPSGLSIGVATPVATPAGLCILSGTATQAGDFPLTVQVTDSASNTASSSLTFVAVSSSLPTISSVTATSASSTSETITWTTSVPADSRIAYGASYGLGYETPEQDTAGVTSHSVTIKGLMSGTQYFYTVISSGVSGGSPQDYLRAYAGYYNYSFNTVAAATSGAFDFGIQGAGPHDVVQGYPIYVGVYNWSISGTSSFVLNSLKFQITGIPPNSQVHWPDQQDFGLGQGTISSTLTTNDTLTQYEPGNTTQFSILTNVGGTTPSGTYTLTVTATTNGGAGPTHYFSWPINVCAVNAACGESSAYSSAAPSSYPTIPSLSTWQSNMTTYGAKWANFACTVGLDEQATYYDGEHVYDQIAKYTGNSTTWTAAAQNSRSCYTAYGNANNWGLPGYWVFPHGLYEDCTSGSSTASASCADLHSLATHASGYQMWANALTFADSQNIREGCYRLGALRLDYDAGGGTTLAYVKAAAAYCLGDVDQVVNGTGIFEESFMDGLAAQALIEYYLDPNTGDGDPRVPPAMQALADHLWENNWIPWNGTNGMFVYNPYVLTYGIIQPSDATAVDLEATNLLDAPLFAWVFSITGNQKYQLEGDAIWSGGVNDPSSDGDYTGKAFSQQYRWSLDYVTWRSAP